MSLEWNPTSEGLPTMIREMAVDRPPHCPSLLSFTTQKDRPRNVPRRMDAVFALSIECMWLEIQSLLIESNRRRANLTFLIPARRNFLKPFGRDIDEQIYLQIPFRVCTTLRVSDQATMSKLPLASCFYPSCLQVMPL